MQNDAQEHEHCYSVTGESGRSVLIDKSLADLAGDRDQFLRMEFERVTGEPAGVVIA